MASTPFTTVPTSSKARNSGLADAFRSESGAFDLPSIIVGIVVVGVLTAGVLAAIFGVIPFAQDKGAQQDLDSLRTAEGVAKGRDDSFKTSAGLTDAGYLPGSPHLAADTDASGSCYTAVALSGSGKLHVATSAAPTPVELTASTDPGCVTSAQLKSLVESVGGTWSGTTGVTVTPIVAPQGSSVRPVVLAYMNAWQSALGSPEYLKLAVALKNGDQPGQLAAMSSAPMMALEAATNALYSSTDDHDQYDQLTHAPGPAALNDAFTEHSTQMIADPTTAVQQEVVDLQHAFLQAAVDGAPAS